MHERHFGLTLLLCL